MATLIDIINELKQPVVDEIYKIVYQPIDKYLGVKILPVKTYNQNTIRVRIWETGGGLMKPALPRTQAPEVGLSGIFYEVEYQGIPFKEAITFTNEDLLALEEAPSDIRLEVITNRVKEFKNRAYTRIEQLIWNALKGRISLNENGLKYEQTYDIQVATTSANWTNPDTDILKDMIVNCEKIVEYGGIPTYIIMNSTTLLNTLYVNNFFKDTLKYGGYLEGFSNIQKIIKDRTGAELVIYDERYWDDARTTATKFVGDYEVFYIGEHPDLPVGEFIMVKDPNTATYHGEAKAGFWNKVDIYDHDPYSVKIIAGFKGAPAIYFPRFVVYDSNCKS